MIEVQGKYNAAKINTDNVEQEAIAQIIELCNQEFVQGSKIRIMTDTHAGAGCTIGTTMTIQDKIVPNLVGVDIGCGMENVKLKNTEIDLEKLDRVPGHTCWLTGEAGRLMGVIRIRTSLNSEFVNKYALGSLWPIDIYFYIVKAAPVPVIPDYVAYFIGMLCNGSLYRPLLGVIVEFLYTVLIAFYLEVDNDIPF